MASIVLPTSHRKAWPDAAVSVITIAMLYIGTIGTSAFFDLKAAPESLTNAGGGNHATQALFITTAAFAAAALIRYRPPLDLLWRHAPLLILGAWMVLNVLVSAEHGNTLRRVITLGISLSGATSLLAINRSPRQFATNLGLFALIVIAVSYIGLVVAPDLTMHSRFDIREPEHDGDWRGLFPHKNEAGAAMVSYIFIGWYVLRTGDRVFGALIIALSAVFLFFTHAKSPIGLLPLVLLQSFAYGRLRSSVLRGVVLLGPVTLIGILTIGSAAWPPLESLTRLVVHDTSFTGRSEIWKFAFDNIAQRRLTGFGLGAFWGTAQVVFGGANASGWTNTVGDAHNGYVNMMVELGLPGTVIAVWFLIIGPFRDLESRPNPRRLAPAGLFFMQTWLFIIQLAMFEGIFFEPNGLFFVLLITLGGMRLMRFYAFNDRAIE